MPELKGCISFWESKLTRDRYLMDTSTQTLLENTVRNLKELEKLKEELKQRPKAKFPDNKPEKVQIVKDALINTGYTFAHPTLVLEGQDGWFAILTPRRKPHQAIAHFDGKVVDFFATVPEMIIS